VATMQVYDNFNNYKAWNPQYQDPEGWEVSAVYSDTASSKSTGQHAVKIVGWGQTQAGEKYWHVANSWGAAWNGGGYFKIKRGDNFCEIESTVCYASPIGAGNTNLAPNLKKTNRNHLNTPVDQMPGAWMKQSDLTHATALKNQHASAMAANHAQTRRSSAPLSSDPTDYTVTAAHTQVVAGTKHHLEMAMIDSRRGGQSHTVHAIIHEDTEGNQHLLSTRTEVNVAEISSESPTNQDSGKQGDFTLVWITAVAVAAFIVGASFATLVSRRNDLSRTVLMKDPTATISYYEAEDAEQSTSGTRDRQSSVQAIDIDAPTRVNGTPSKSSSKAPQASTTGISESKTLVLPPTSTTTAAIAATSSLPARPLIKTNPTDRNGTSVLSL